MSQFAVNGKVPIAVWCPSRDDAGNGTATLNDLVGSNHGTLTNMDPATDWVADTGAGGIRALDFDGSNDYVVSSTSAFRFLNTTFSVSAWLKFTSAANMMAVAVDFGSFTPGWVIQSASGKILCAIKGAGGVLAGGRDTTATFNDGNWHNVVAVFTTSTTTAANNDVVIYVDGSLASVGARLSTGLYATPADNAWLGRRQSGTPYYTGRSDDIRIFSTSVNSTDVSYLYNGGSGRGRLAGVRRRVNINGGADYYNGGADQ